MDYRLERAKMGAIMGGTVGLCFGLIFGGYTVIRFGPGPRGYINTLSHYMLNSAGTFAFIMGVGSAIRSEALADGVGKQHERWRELAAQSSRGFASIPVEVKPMHDRRYYHRKDRRD